MFLVKILEEYEFFSLLKKLDTKKESKEEIKYQIIDNLDNINIDNYAIYLTTNGSYHDKLPHGLALYNKDNAYYIEFKNINNFDIFNNTTFFHLCQHF